MVEQLELLTKITDNTYHLGQDSIALKKEIKDIKEQLDLIIENQQIIDSKLNYIMNNMIKDVKPQ